MVTFDLHMKGPVCQVSLFWQNYAKMRLPRAPINPSPPSPNNTHTHTPKNKSETENPPLLNRPCGLKDAQVGLPGLSGMPGEPSSPDRKAPDLYPGQWPPSFAAGEAALFPFGGEGSLSSKPGPILVVMATPSQNKRSNRTDKHGCDFYWGTTSKAVGHESLRKVDVHQGVS